MKESDRYLIYELRETALLLSVDPSLPERRNITEYFVYQKRGQILRAIEQAIERILSDKD